MEAEQRKLRIDDYLSETLGIEILRYDGKKVESRLLVSKKHVAPNGFLHATVIVGLADITCGWGTHAALAENARGFATIELKSNFLGTCQGGYIFCTAVGEHIGKRTQVWDATVQDEAGEKLALFRCTQMMLQG